jgi:hypothetical protein
VGGLAYVTCLCSKSGVLSPKDYIYLCKKRERGLSLLLHVVVILQKRMGAGVKPTIIYRYIRYKKVGGGPLNSDAYVTVVKIRGQVVLAPC